MSVDDTLVGNNNSIENVPEGKMAVLECVLTTVVEVSWKLLELAGNIISSIKTTHLWNLVQELV